MTNSDMQFFEFGKCERFANFTEFHFFEALREQAVSCVSLLLGYDHSPGFAKPRSTDPLISPRMRHSITRPGRERTRSSVPATGDIRPQAGSSIPA